MFWGRLVQSCFSDFWPSSGVLCSEEVVLGQPYHAVILIGSFVAWMKLILSNRKIPCCACDTIPDSNSWHNFFPSSAFLLPRFPFSWYHVPEIDCPFAFHFLMFWSQLFSICSLQFSICPVHLEYLPILYLHVSSWRVLLYILNFYFLCMFIWLHRPAWKHDLRV